MRREGGYYAWKKGEKARLSAHFGTWEFECKCSYDDCVEQRVAVELIEKLSWLREVSRSTVRIHSGFRCQKKQADLRASGIKTVAATKSTHELGDAADVSSSTLTPPELRLLAEKRFEAIGTAPNFLHLDLRKGKKRRWAY